MPWWSLCWMRFSTQLSLVDWGDPENASTVHSFLILHHAHVMHEDAFPCQIVRALSFACVAALALGRDTMSPPP